MPLISGLIVDWDAVTNARSIIKAEAEKILLDWGINELLDLRVIAGTTCPMEVTLQLLRRYRSDDVEDQSIIDGVVQRFQVSLTAQLRVQKATRRYLMALSSPGVNSYGIGLVVTYWQSSCRPTLVSSLFPGKQQFVIGPSGFGSYTDAIHAAMVILQFTSGYCIGVFGSAAAMRAAKKLHIVKKVGHLNGQGSEVREALTSVGADATVTDWNGVLQQMHDLGCTIPNPQLGWWPPRAEPQYLSAHRGFPSSYFNRDGRQKGPSANQASWLYQDEHNARLVERERRKTLRL